MEPSKITTPEIGTPKKRRRFTRRGFLKAFGTVALVGGGTYAYGSTIEVHRLVTEHVTFDIPGLAAARHGTRIVQLSDFHTGRTSFKHIARSIEIAAALKPDFLLFTGDFVDSSLNDFDKLCDLFASVTKNIETIACTGNHDFWHGRTFADEVCTAVAKAGVNVLRNATYQPRPGLGELCFAGFEDYWYRFDPKPLSNPPPDASVIVLSHNPDSYDELAQGRWHLMLSGHTHGGQVRIPGIGPILLPVDHRERDAGLFHLDPALPDRALYVSRGVGHLLKIRLFCPPEVTCFTLRNPAMP